jgi:hypothetical protein
LIVESPIVVIVGNKGAGKTLFLTHRAEFAHNHENRKVFSNYHLTEIPYEPFTYEMLTSLPEHMTNGIIVADEGQMGADAYDFLNHRSRAMTTLATQLRKRNLELWVTTQRYKFLAKRIRDLADYVFTMQVAKDEQNQLIKGIAHVEIYDRADPFSNEPIQRFIFDGRQYFGHYDTTEVITSGETLDDK